MFSVAELDDGLVDLTTDAPSAFAGNLGTEVVFREFFGRLQNFFSKYFSRPILNVP